MDKLYLLMVKEAKEIQDAWEPKRGDRILLESGFTDFVDAWCDKKDYTWLPYQEDLQEIAYKELKMSATMELLDTFLNTLYTVREGHIDATLKDGAKLGLSLNGLWLAFVMETVYDKCWNGETWEMIK